jgi:hypothetical protein
MKFHEFLVIYVRISAISANLSETTTQQSVKCGRKPAGIGKVYGEINIRIHSWPWLSISNQKNLITSRRVRSLLGKELLGNQFHLFPAVHCFEEKHRK